MSGTAKRFVSVMLAFFTAISVLAALTAAASAGRVIKCKLGYEGDSVTVTLTKHEDANKIYYTTDGSKPTTSSKKYSGTLSFEKKVRIRAVEYDKKGKKTASLNAVVKPRVQPPTIKITTKSDGTKYISASSATKGAVFCYTTDGSEPTSSSPRLKGSIPYTDGVTVTVTAFRSGMLSSVSVRYNSLGETAASADGETPEEGIAAVFALMNEERAARGVTELILDETLCEAAAVRAKELASVYDHVRPDGNICSAVLKEFGITYRTEGENIARKQNTAQKVMERWMGSPAHKANIINADFGRTGVGCYEENGVKYWVQLFTD